MHGIPTLCLFLLVAYVRDSKWGDGFPTFRMMPEYKYLFPVEYEHAPGGMVQHPN